MKQINNGFTEEYYLEKDGTVYNKNTKRYIHYNKNYSVSLKTIDGKYKKIALSNLYRLVYNTNYCNDTIENIDNEEWKDIYNTDGMYKISNKGRVKSMCGYNAIILKNYANKAGYLRVDIIENGVRQCKLVHRLVAAAFMPPPDNIDMQLHHKDYNKQNNAVDNLEWLTPQKHKEKHKERNKNNVSTKSKENIY